MRTLACREKPLNGIVDVQGLVEVVVASRKCDLTILGRSPVR